MKLMKAVIVICLVMASIFVFPTLAQKGATLAEAIISPSDNTKTPTEKEPIDSSPAPSGEKGNAESPQNPAQTETPDKPGSSAGKTENSALTEFPDSLTVVAMGEVEAAKVKQKPSADSTTLGVVYGSLTHVEVLGEADNGYVEVYTRDYNSGKMIHGYMLKKQLKQVSTNKQYGIVVDTDDQKVYIYKDNALYKTFICSTGLEGGYETPEGIYIIGSRGPSFYSPKYKQGAYNWVRFNKGYLFHSLPFDENQNLIASEGDKLGTKASHGCVRLALEDAKWFYDNIPAGTIVIVQK